VRDEPLDLNKARAALGNQSRRARVPGNPAPNEQSSVTDAVMANIRKLNGKAIKLHGGPMQNNEPDIIGTILGITFVIETKRSGSDGPTLGQQTNLRRWQAAGAVALWGDDPNDIMRRLLMAIQDVRKDMRNT